MDEDKDKGLLIPLEKTFAPKLRHYDFVQDVRMNYYKTYPDKVKYTVEIFDTLPRMSGADDVVKETFNPFRELIKQKLHIPSMHRVWRSQPLTGDIGYAMENTLFSLLRTIFR